MVDVRDFLGTELGQKNLSQQIDFEHGSFKRGIISDYMLSLDSDGKVRYDKSKIAGKYDDLQSRFDSTIRNIDRKGDIAASSTEHISQMSDIRSRRAAREAIESSGTERYLRTSLGLDRDLSIASKAPKGGGIGARFNIGNTEVFGAMGAAHHANRAFDFARGVGAGSDLLNSVGLLSKHQKDLVSSSSVSKFNRAVIYGGAAAGAVYSGMNAAEYMSGKKDSTITDNALTSVAGEALAVAGSVAAFRVTKESTHALTSLVPKGLSKSLSPGSKVGTVAKGLSKTRTPMKWATGFTAGSAGFLAVNTAISGGLELFKESSKQDNSINRLKNKLYKGDTIGDFDVKTDQLQTMRQRTLSKLSKSALNDRANLLGNEAMVLRGLL